MSSTFCNYTGASSKPKLTDYPARIKLTYKRTRFVISILIAMLVFGTIPRLLGIDTVSEEYKLLMWFVDINTVLAFILSIFVYIFIRFMQCRISMKS